MTRDHTKYALFDYNQAPSETDKFKLGDVVISDNREIGVIIQCHGNDEYRTDMFGNCCFSEVREHGDIQLATAREIMLYRPSLFKDK